MLLSSFFGGRYFSNTTVTRRTFFTSKPLFQTPSKVFPARSAINQSPGGIKRDSKITNSDASLARLELWHPKNCYREEYIFKCAASKQMSNSFNAAHPRY
jgi:hypothetical protein